MNERSGEIQYLLTDGPVYPWIKDGNVAFRGYFLCEESLYTGAQAIKKIRSEGKNIINLARMFDGSFSIIVELEDEVILLTDRVRSLALYYRKGEKVFSISDNAACLKRDADKKNEAAILEFAESVLWVSGEKTLYEDILSVQAGEYVIYHKERMDIIKDYYYQWNAPNGLNEKVSKEDFWQAYDKVGLEMVKILNGRTAIVPLSGGADSRMIVDLLKKHNYKNVICFTYGDAKSKEVLISKEVARDRGYQWICIPYTKQTYKNFVSSGEFYEYAKFAANYTSLPHVQDYYAVSELKKRGVIPEDGVFIPGHSGDMIAGSHITQEFLRDTMTGKAFVDWILQKFYFSSKSKALRDSLLEFFTLEENEEYETNKLLCMAEAFNIRERQAKFIINSVRTYEYFGHEWLIPLWSNTLMDFWNEIPKTLRYQRKFYFECVGLDTIKSTNDVTMYTKASALVHKCKWLTAIVRKVYRIKEYYTHPWHIGECVSFGKYLSRVLRTNEHFSLNHVIYDLYMSGLEKRGY